MDDTFGSPVDMARSYMKVRPPWASPTVDQSGLGTPSHLKAKLFEEGTPYTGDSSSSLKVFEDFGIAFIAAVSRSIWSMYTLIYGIVVMVQK